MFGLRLRLRDDTLSGHDHPFLLYYHGMNISYIFLSKIQYSKRKHVYDYTCMYPAASKHGNRIEERTCYLLLMQRTILLLLRAHVQFPMVLSRKRKKKYDFTCPLEFTAEIVKTAFILVQAAVSYRSSCCGLIRNSWSPNLIRGGVTV